MMRAYVLGVTVIMLGLIAGFIYSYSISVMPGLANLSDPDFVRAMQELNQATLNGWFFLTFMGAPLLLAIASIMHLVGDRSIVTWLVIAAAVLYIVGVFGVTVAVNVPLNEALDRIGPNASADELSRARDTFEGRWKLWNDVRTISVICSLVLLVTATFLRNGK